MIMIRNETAKKNIRNLRKSSSNQWIRWTKLEMIYGSHEIAPTLGDQRQETVADRSTFVFHSVMIRTKTMALCLWQLCC